MKSDAVQTIPAEHTTSVGITCDLCVQDHYVHEDSYHLASVDDDNEDSSFCLSQHSETELESSFVELEEDEISETQTPNSVFIVYWSSLLLLLRPLLDMFVHGCCH